MERFEVVRLIGEGGYGIVYKCKSKDTGDIVAIKKIKHSVDGDPRKVGLREIKILNVLKHPNINQLIGAFKSKDRLFLVLECVEITLLDVLNEFPRGIVCHRYRGFTYQLACALQYCHSKGIVHRDVKPENLLVTSKDVLKLCDFGFARFLPSSKTNVSILAEEDLDGPPSKASYHQLTVYVATRWYRPPELILRMPYGKPVDVWTIGCILVEMATGEPLFCGDTDLDQLHQIKTTLGTFTSDQMDAMLASAKYQFINLQPNSPGHVAKDKLQQFRELLGDEMYDVLQRCIINDPCERITAEECVNHPCFELERRTLCPQMAAFGKLSGLLNPHPTTAKRRRSWDWSKMFMDSGETSGISSTTSTNPGTPKSQSSTVSISKEEEMLMGAENDLEKERENENSLYSLVKKQRELTLKSGHEIESLYSLPKQPLSAKKRSPLSSPRHNDTLPTIVNNNRSAHPHHLGLATPGNSLQRSPTWFQPSQHGTTSHEREGSSIAVLTKQFSHTAYHAARSNVYESDSTSSSSVTTPRKKSSRAGIALSNKSQNINTYVSRTSDIVKWDTLRNKHKSKEVDFTGAAVRSLGQITNFKPPPVAKASNSRYNDLRLPEFK